ncbi:MAG: DoxX family membrane protein [Acidobacteriia bacterium]|nr:DoxX family membrane protein [Terriglobia bacterium]
MAYSQLRLRKTLAVVRVLTGILFLFLGAHKISSLEFAKLEFPQFVWDATHGAAVGFYADLLSSAVESHPSGIAVLIGLTELFIGVGLVLGLAVRPISVLGMVYMLNLILATWMAPGPNVGLWLYLDNEFKLITMFFLFLLFGIGHAGESLGLGALYHRRRRVKWAEVEASQEESADGRAYDRVTQLYGTDEDDAARDRELGIHSIRFRPTP